MYLCVGVWYDLRIGGCAVVPTRSEWDKILENNIREMDAKLEAEKQMAEQRAKERAEKRRKYIFAPLKVVATAIVTAALAWAIEFFFDWLI